MGAWPAALSGSVVAPAVPVVVHAPPEVECPAPASPHGGYIEVSSFRGSYHPGATASYRCNPGQVLWGNSSSSCGPHGVWSSPAPSCRAIDCGGPPHVENTMAELVNG